MREDDVLNGYTYCYTYDFSGNITSKKKHPLDNLNLVLDTVTYTYGANNWGDLLTNYDGTAISYDAIGNPSNWRNTSEMTWDGRQLDSLVLTSNDSTLDFTYNSNGIRTKNA